MAKSKSGSPKMRGFLLVFLLVSVEMPTKRVNQYPHYGCFSKSISPKIRSSFQFYLEISTKRGPPFSEAPIVS